MEKKKNEHPNWGGKRPGAGRPKTTYLQQVYTIRTHDEIASFINEHENKADFIKECVIKEMKRVAAESVVPAEILKAAEVPAVGENTESSLVAESSDNSEFAKLGEATDSNELIRILCPNLKDTCIIRIKGNAMEDADILNGDIIIVDKSNCNPTEKELAVCMLNKEYTIKHVHVRDGRGILIPANPSFHEWRITEDDVFRVLGTVTHIIHKPGNF